MPIGTARMANLCLPNSELNIGVDWEDSAVLQRVLSDPSRPAVLLYPSEGQEPVTGWSSEGPVTLVVVDGTWSQARKVVRRNPTLARLPRLAFEPETPSEYRIRREPSAECVSTIEALMIALGKLERAPERFLAMLTPFRRMIDRQIELREANRAVPCRHVKKGTPLDSRIPSVLRERGKDLVCVVGEANAWPWRAEVERAKFRDELIHWVAHRPASGETFEAIVRMQHPLAPRTTTHVGLSEEELMAGRAPALVLEQWRQFLRESDVVCSWGSYALNLFAAMGGSLPPLRLDLRYLIKDLLKRNIGTLESFAGEFDAGRASSLGRGRAGSRLALLSQITHQLSQGSLPVTDSAATTRARER
jgi:DTW domain-containing protein YfiP